MHGDVWGGVWKDGRDCVSMERERERYLFRREMEKKDGSHGEKDKIIAN